MNKLHIHQRICTSNSVVASVYANMYADVHNTGLTYTPAHAWCSRHLSKCIHNFRKKCTSTRVCALMKRYRSSLAMKAIANSSWVLREHRTGCCLPPVLPAVSTKSVARHCSLKKSVQIHANSWRGRCCNVSQASFDHPRWCRPRPVCLWVALALGHGAHFIKSYFGHLFARVFSNARHCSEDTEANRVYSNNLLSYWQSLFSIAMYIFMESELTFEGQRVRVAQNLSVRGLYDCFLGVIIVGTRKRRTVYLVMFCFVLFSVQCELQCSTV